MNEPTDLLFIAGARACHRGLPTCNVATTMLLMLLFLIVGRRHPVLPG